MGHVTMPNGGFPIVLTADRTLMAAYPTLLDGMTAASQTTTTPGLLMRTLLAPKAKSNGTQPTCVPLGLRRIEAALVRDGFTPNQIGIVPAHRLREAVGPGTRVVGISSGDPLGLGMNSTTMTGIAGGRSYTSVYFQQLARRTARWRRHGLDFRVVMGGPGAWQLADNPRARRTLRIDHVVTGYCEGNVADVFRNVMAGDDPGAVVVGRPAARDRIPAVLGPSSMGVVEISRGCGWGCRFCTLAHDPMVHLSPDTILADVTTNVTGGVTNVALISEDLFRYGAGPGERANPAALIDLVARVRAVPGVRLIQSDHANVTTLAAWSSADLAEVRRLLVANAHHQYPWVNVGVETASGTLLAANVGARKLQPFDANQWPDVCLEQTGRLIDAGFLPMVSLVMGLPGETGTHVRQTIRWVERLTRRPVTVFPLVYAPVRAEPNARPATSPLSRDHWRLIRTCYRHNFEWVPRLIWNTQTRGGVGLARRLVLQAMGRGQIWLWRTLFVARSSRLLP